MKLQVCLGLTLCLPLLLPIGCNDHKAGTGGMAAPPDMTVLTLGPAPALSQPCSDALADVYTLPANLPAFDDSHRGDVFRCAVTESLSAAKVNDEAKGYGYSGPELPSGFWTWRIGYRTRRPAPESTPSAVVEGASSAMVLVPDKPLPGAPLVVFAHGSVGINDHCAPSHFDLTSAAPAMASDQEDYPANLYALAGYGYTVIAPDYSGFSYGMAPGYFSAPDEAYSLLDATRAAANLFPASIVPADPKVVIVGHSQGGHAALASQALVNQPTFGMKGTLTGVVAFAPMYFSLASWSAMITSVASSFGYTTDKSAHALLFGLQYFYSIGELYDGPGHGLDHVAAAKRDAVKGILFNASCYDYDLMTTLGSSAYDYMDQSFADDVGNCALYGPQTTDNPCASAQAAVWMARWKKDRPPLDPAGAKTLIFYGGMDTLVLPALAQCELDTFAATNATPVTQICYDSNAAHNNVVRLDADYVNRWIAHQADATKPDPGSCGAFPTDQTCRTPPPNSL